MTSKLLIGTAGAPTVVLDASLRALCESLPQEIEVWSVIGGPLGLTKGAFELLDPLTLSAAPQAGSVLGSGRRGMSASDPRTIATSLARNDIRALILAGGNGTMSLLSAIDRESKDLGLSLNTIGIPKTVDNDLLGVDFSPGFASAARYLHNLLPGMGMDLAAMSSVETIRVVETMGRGTGWLAAAASSGPAITRREDTQVDLCLVPEVGPVDQNQLAASVEEIVRAKGHALVVCSEGVVFDDDAELYTSANHSRLMVGGVSRRIARSLESTLDMPARGEVLGTQQRSSIEMASQADIRVAGLVGRAAAQFLAADMSGIMVGTERLSSYPLEYDVVPVPLEIVAGVARPLPPAFYPPDLTSFRDWLVPLVGPLST